MNLEFQIEYVNNLVKNPMNYFINPNLRNISHFHQENVCLYFSLHVIETLKRNVEYYSREYLYLTHNECVARQKIQETSYSLLKAKVQLNLAYSCAKEIQEVYPKLNIRYPIDTFVGMQEEATILTKLSKIEGSLDKLNDALKLFEIVKNKTTDKQLQHLAMMNEANLRLSFAIENINPRENCIKSIKLSEKARKYYNEGHKLYESIFQNQLNATLELEISESYGFRIENMNRIKKILKITEPFNSINKLKLRLRLIKLGIAPTSDLDLIYLDIQKLKQNTPISKFNHHQARILEGELLIQKAKNSENSIEYQVNLSKAINLFIRYRQENTFKDKYYEVKSKYKEANARLLIYKSNNDENELYKSLNLLTEAKAFYTKTPLQNQIIHCPRVLYLLALTKKEIYSKNKTLNRNYFEIEKLLLNATNGFERRNNYEKIVKCYLELGRLFFNIKKFKESHEYLKNGAELIETMRDSITDLNLKETFFDKSIELYKLMINTCYCLDTPKETLKYVELTKQRLFLDKILLNQRINPLNSTTPNLITRLNSIEKEISQINEELNNFDENNFIYSALYEKLLKAKKEQFNIISKIKNHDPIFYNNYFNNIQDYSNINLEDKTLIEYYYNENYLLIILIDKNKYFMEKVNFTNKDNLFQRLKGIIVDTKHDLENLDEFNELLREFHNILIKPIKNNISNEKLLIIPYGQLHNVPFNGLYCEDYLINDYEITIVQSATLAKYLKNNYVARNDEYLVIGNPTGDLKHSEKEANKISNLLNTKPVIYKDAKKENILNLMKNKKIIHFAGHGNLNITNPMESSLTLSDDELFLKDLENKHINSELIVLSSCETGLVSVTGLDENRGFVNYLQINGAKYVIAPLWSVIDECTFELFDNFYPIEYNYSTQLRNSQLKLKNKYDIYKWGAFQIYGI